LQAHLTALQLEACENKRKNHGQRQEDSSADQEVAENGILGEKAALGMTEEASEYDTAVS
jgi:hypothetical protein